MGQSPVLGALAYSEDGEKSKPSIKVDFLNTTKSLYNYILTQEDCWHACLTSLSRISAKLEKAHEDLRAELPMLIYWGWNPILWQLSIREKPQSSKILVATLTFQFSIDSLKQSQGDQRKKKIQGWMKLKIAQKSYPRATLAHVAPRCAMRVRRANSRESWASGISTR